MLAEHQLSLPFLTLDTATGRSLEVLEKAKAQVGFIPNMYAGMAHCPGLLETYLHGYGAFKQESGLTSAEQEIVFLAISLENGCEYCVGAHSMLAATRSGVPAATIEAMRAGTAIPDAKQAALAHFTRFMVSSRGLPSKAEAKKFLDAGFTEKNILEILLAIAVKTISNYSNHMLHTPLDAPFKDWEWKDKR
ncbi:MAG: carboxymuconolactone decarboxylase family protein [Pseudomonadales bacterium]|nr:carboxymuconolactone decarboxylase family protein [Pseudomonadales bacterium]